jgi:HEAT repeat protein
MTPSTHFWEEPLYRLILQITVLQVIVLGAFAAGIVLLRWLKLSRDKRRRRMSEALNLPLMSYVAGDVALEPTYDAIRRFPGRLISLELEKYAMMLGGEALSKLRALYERLGLGSLALRLVHSLFWWRRLEGIRLLGVTGGGDVVEVLLEALKDQHAIVRLAAARSLGRIRSPKAIKPIIEIMAASRQLSRRQLAQTLVAFGPVTHPALRRIVASEEGDEAYRRLAATAIEVLAITGDIDSGPEIRRSLLSEEMEVRIAAYKAVVLLHLPLTEEELRRGLTDPAWQVRAQAALAAGKVGGDDLVTDLGACLTDRSWWVRQNAGTALYALGPRGVEQLEIVSQTSPDRFARDMAFRTLTSDPLYHLTRTDLRSGPAPEAASETGEERA